MSQGPQPGEGGISLSESGLSPDSPQESDYLRAVRGVSHDLRNSLHALRLAVELLKSAPAPPGDDGRKHAELVEWMERDVAKASRLLDTLVALVKKQSSGEGG